MISLAGGLPADDLLPREALAKAFAAVSRAGEALQYGWPEGDSRVRSWVAERLARRGACVDPNAIIVTAGAQQALSLAARWLARRSQLIGPHTSGRIAVGDATYAGALDAFRAAGLSPVVARVFASHYAMPGVSNPHGVDLVDRERLLACGEPIIVDEAYAELRFDGQIDRPLYADAPDRVFHVGTISKTVSPGLRLGWLIPPPALHAALVELKHADDLQAASAPQAAFAELLDRVDYDALVERGRAQYRQRAARCVEALHRHVHGIAFTEPEGAFSVWLTTDLRGDDVALLELAVAEGVTFDPGSDFRPEPTDQIALRVSYSNTPLDRIEEGARRLGRVLDRARRQRRVRYAVGAG
jgi:2-aminoadipate transaminase